MAERRAHEGICLMLNNDVDGARDLLESEIDEDSDDELPVETARCFVTLIHALLSCEQDGLDDAIEKLRHLEKRCSQPVSWFSAVREKMFGSKQNLTESAEKLDEQITLADSQVCLALLVFLQQDLSSYFQGAWRLRRAWRVYQHTYSHIQSLYRRSFPEGSCNRSASQQFEPSSPTQPGVIRSSISYLSALSSYAFPAPPPDSLSREEVSRLMSAVSFGYGVFQLCVSLLPPSLLKVVHVLGFHGDREAGVRALMFAKQGQHMRAPLALLALLWYQTIVRPYLGVDGGSVEAGVDQAQQLYEETQLQFADSALFLFFLGRIRRLKCDMPGALTAFENAIEKSPQREVQLLCLHEVGWVYLLQLDWGNAYHCFQNLRVKSRWSGVLYSYLTAVCAGANGNLTTADGLIKELPSLVSGTEALTNIDLFVMRRQRVLENCLSKSSCTLLATELLYLWNALPSSNPILVLSECDNCNEEPIIGLRLLLRGVLSGYLGRYVEAEDIIRECLKQRSEIHNDSSDPCSNLNHVSAFANIELAAILLKRPESVEEGLELLNQTSQSYSSYDFENKASVRIQVLSRSHHP